MNKYNHQKIERKWQKEWEKKQLYKTPDEVKGKKNFYALVEFPYPSGNLHTGHWYAFSVPDIFARKKRMEGKNVLFPIGFDAFGLPAENAAIKRGINPKKWTYDNIAYMRKQLRSMGASFDWTREVITADPSYYEWTQWLFLKFFQKGLAYQAETSVNWCPQDKTVLANEQIVGGKCERCGSEVIQREMKQWMLKITGYAEKLLAGLEKLNWKKEIKEAQRNWIGKSEGALIKFKLTTHHPSLNTQIEVFTTRPDTIFGATYLVLAPEHKLVQNLKSKIQNWKEVERYIAEANRKTSLQRQQNIKNKTGVALKGVAAINPATKKEISVWISDYVLASYGTGAIMAVPAHDERDFEFALKFNLPIMPVIKSPQKRNFIFIHGLMDDHNAHFWPYLKTELEKFGHSVFALDMPNSKNPTLNEWASELDKYKSHINEDSVLVGHSVGGAFIIRWLQRNNVKIHSAVLIAPVFSSEYSTFRDKVKDIADQPFDESVKKKAKNLLYFASDGDNKRLEQVRKYKEMLGGHVIYLPKRGHFTVSEIGKEFPELLSYILSLDNFTGAGKLINAGKFNGMDSEGIKTKIVEFVGGKIKIEYKLRDWVVSRQRYWGVPIPIIHCKSCRAQAVRDGDLPVLLPDIKDYLPTGEGRSPLAKAKKWIAAKCPKCGGEAERETDTLDTFVDSSWYFLRYCDPKNSKNFVDAKKAKNWMPVDLYSGGAEHTTMHLLYSRFFYKAICDLDLLGGSTAKLGDEPYSERRNRGIILGSDGQKMSKSKGNVVDPDEYIKKFGADTVRMYLAFIGPYNETGSYPWDPHGIFGIKRFLDRVWNLIQNSKAKIQNDSSKLKDLEKLIHKAIKKVGEDIDDFKFNTAISTTMVLLNEVETGAVSKKTFETFLKLLAPFAPHLAEEIWFKLGNKKSIHLEKWPSYDPKLVVEDTFELIVQVNGKIRDKFEIPINFSQSEAERLTLARDKVKLALENKKPSRVVFVPKRLINFVV